MQAPPCKRCSTRHVAPSRWSRTDEGRSMTEELLREDATLLSCEARVVALAEGGVILDRTVFYPQGGGQAGDTGVLRAADGSEFPVVDTRKSKEHPGGVLHLLAPGAAAPA